MEKQRGINIINKDNGKTVGYAQLCTGRILHLTLKKQWFDLIASGEKKEEYREMKPYWHKRLLNKTYDKIIFKNGYSKDAPTMIVEFKGLMSGLGIEKWGANLGEKTYIIKLGKVLFNNALM